MAPRAAATCRTSQYFQHLTPRAYWKSYLRLPLVTRPVALFRAARDTTKSQSFVIGGLKLFRLAPRINR
ncbi:MAG: hypothetical protein ACREDJ_10205, partial [Methylocella sp.]